MTILTEYNYLCNKQSDINEHLPTLREYAAKCNHVTEMGVRRGVSTWAFLAGTKGKVISYDINYNLGIEKIKEATLSQFEFIQADVLKIEIEETDLLFIDTWHVYKQLKAELQLHASKARKYIILHDTTKFNKVGEDGGEGLQKALIEFLNDHKEWRVREVFTNNNGLTVLAKV